MRRVELVLDRSGVECSVGTLTVQSRGDRATSQFSYAPEFVYGEGFALAPALALDDGYFTFRGLPLFIQDAGPDRWGAHLLRREALARDPLSLPDDFDNILGASDFARQGALRLKDPGTGHYLSGRGVPAQLSLTELLAAADEVTADTESFAPFAQLLETGTSALGGARPKASVFDTDGRLMIAKFPMLGDRRNVPAWEKLALNLAEQVGIAVPPSQLVKVAGRDVLLLERFDRVGYDRIPYLSYCTLMNNPDDGRRPPDYLEIATMLRRTTDADLEDLFRRTVFGVLINNTDDHLRNMGLLRRDNSWSPAPLFDVNPDPEAGRPRHTGISGHVGLFGIREGLEALGKACGISQSRAHSVVDEVRDVVVGWRALADHYEITEREIDRMAATFAIIEKEVRPA